MNKSHVCCMSLMLALFAGLHSVIGPVSKRSCRGDSIRIFQNISFNNESKVVTLYKHADSAIILGMWQIKDVLPSIIYGQSDRVFLDKSGNIWILNLHVSDEATYVLTIDIETKFRKYEVQLDVLVPPTKNCKPKIIRAGNSLFVQLKTDECGRPAATAYWLEHPGYIIERQVIQLQSGIDKGVYHACIEGHSLMCADIFSFSDYCSIYNDSESETLIDNNVCADCKPRNLHGYRQSSTSESLSVTTLVCAIQAILLLFLIPYFLMTTYTRWQRRNRKSITETSHENCAIACSHENMLPARSATPTIYNNRNVIEIERTSVEGGSEPFDSIVDDICNRGRFFESISIEGEGNEYSEIRPVEVMSVPFPVEEESSESSREHQVEGTMLKTPENTTRSTRVMSWKEDGRLMESQ